MLCVAGLTLATGHVDDSVGAIILFATNFLSICVVGVIVLMSYKVHMHSPHRNRPGYRWSAFFILFSCLGVVGTMLTKQSLILAKQREIKNA